MGLPKYSFFQATSAYEQEFLSQDAHVILNALQEQFKPLLRDGSTRSTNASEWSVDAPMVSSLNIRGYPDEFSICVAANMTCCLTSGFQL